MAGITERIDLDESAYTEGLSRLEQALDRHATKLAGIAKEANQRTQKSSETSAKAAEAALEKLRSGGLKSLDDLTDAANAFEEAMQTAASDTDRRRFHGLAVEARALHQEMDAAARAADDLSKKSRFGKIKGGAADLANSLRTGDLSGAGRDVQALAATVGPRLAAAAAAGTAGVVALGVGTYKAAKNAILFEEAMKEVRKTTGLAGEDLETLGDGILELSARTGIAQEALAGMAATGGQLGIADPKDLLAFTETVAKLSDVSDLSAEESAASIAKISNAFKLPIKEADKLGSVLNELSNTTTARAGDLAQAVTKVGSAGATIGFTVDQVAALSATLIDSGLEAETAGTSLRNVFIRMQTEAAELARVAGIGEQEFTDMLGQRPMEALNLYLDGLRKLPRALQATEIKDVFGDESFLSVQSLATQTEILTRNLGNSAEAFRRGDSLNREFAVGLETVAAQWGLLIARLESMATSVGNTLAPVLSGIIVGLNKIVGAGEDAGDALQSTFAALSETRQVSSALETYNRLVREGKTDSEEYRRVVDKLAERFPDLVSGFDDAGRAAGIYAGQVRSLLAVEQRRLRLQLADELEEQGERVTAAAEKMRRARREAVRAAGAVVEDERKGLVDEVSRLIESGQSPNSILLRPVIQRQKDLADARSEASEYRNELRDLADDLLGVFTPPDDLSGYDTFVDQLRRSLGLTAEDARDLADLMSEIASAPISGSVSPTVVPTTPPSGGDVERRAEARASRDVWAAELTHLDEVRGRRSEEAAMIEQAQAAERERNELVARRAELQKDGATLSAGDAVRLDNQTKALKDQATAYRAAATEARTLAEQHDAQTDALAGQQTGVTALWDAHEQFQQQLDGEQPGTKAYRDLALQTDAAADAAQHAQAAYQELRQAIEQRQQAEAERLTLAAQRSTAADGTDAAAEIDAQIARQDELVAGSRRVEAQAGREAASALELGQVYASLSPDVLRVVNSLEALATRMVEGTATPAALEQIQALTQASKDYATEIQRLETLRALGTKRGGISQSAFDEKAKAATDAYLDSLGQIYATMERLGLLTPEVQAAIAEAMKSATQDTEQADDTMQNLARSIRAMSRLGSVFGGLSDGLRDMLDASADVLGNLSALQKLPANASFLDKLIPGLGIASGIIGIGASLFASSGPSAREVEREQQMREMERQREETMRLRGSIADNIRALERNTRSNFQEGRVGSSTNRETVTDIAGAIEAFRSADQSGENADLTAMRSALDRLYDDLDDAIGRGDDAAEIGISQAIAQLQAQIEAAERARQSALSQQAQSILDSLSDSGISGADQYRETFEKLVGELGMTAAEAFRRILDGDFSGTSLAGLDLPSLSAFIDELLSKLGEYTGDLGGAINLFNTLKSVGGDLQAAFDQLIDFMLASASDIPDVAREWLAGLDGLKLDSEQGRAALKKILDLIRLNEGGVLTQAMQAELIALLGGLEGGASGSAGESNSTSVSRAISEIQGNAVVQWLELIERNTRASAGIDDPMQGGTASLSRGGFTSDQAAQATADLAAIRRNTFRPKLEDPDSGTRSWDDFPGATAAQSDAIRMQIVGARSQLGQIEAHTRGGSGIVDRDILPSSFGADDLAAMVAAFEPLREIPALLADRQAQGASQSLRQSIRQRFDVSVTGDLVTRTRRPSREEIDAIMEGIEAEIRGYLGRL